MRSCAIHVHKPSVEAMLLQQCREVTTVILSITPWLPTYIGQSLIRCNIHGLPRDIVSDRDSRFTSHTWKDFLSVTGIRPRMSMAFHPQTDEQTKRVNQVIKAYLRPYINQEQDDWVDLLPMAEHAYNNSVTSATGMTPFYANYGRHPESQNPKRTEVKNPASYAYAHWIAGALEHGKTALIAARERMTKYADTRRTPPPAYKVGDAVMLSTAHLTLKRPSRKLDHKFIAPFPIQQLISPTAVRLTLPHKWRTHPAFHVAEVELFVPGNRPVDYEKVLREVADIKADEEYDVDEIKGSIKHRNSVLYHVKWLGFPKKKDWTFEPYENFSTEARTKLYQFHINNPAAPRDHRVTSD